jgi:hypothetical protein
MLKRSVTAHADLPELRVRQRELEAQVAALDARRAALDLEAERLCDVGEQAALPVAEVTTARAGLRARLAAALRMRAEAPDLAAEQRNLERREADARRATLQVEAAAAALAEIDAERVTLQWEAAPVADELRQVEAAIAFGEAMEARAKWLDALRAASEAHAVLVVAARCFDTLAPAAGHAPLLGAMRPSLMEIRAVELLGLPDGAQAGQVVAPVLDALVARGVMPPAVLRDGLPATEAPAGESRVPAAA